MICLSEPTRDIRYPMEPETDAKMMVTKLAMTPVSIRKPMLKVASGTDDSLGCQLMLVNQVTQLLKLG